jgi:hypothetical protein
MNKSTLGAFAFLKPSVQKNPRLHTAVFLCPVEVEVAFKDYPAMVRQKLRDHWMLIGAVNRNTYSTFKANAGDDIVAKMTVFPTSAGALYGVLICQVGAHQHRFILPLFAPEVVKFLAFATKASINIYLESAGELREGMLYDCSMSPEAFIPVQRISQAIDLRKRADFILELPTLISEMLTLKLMPSLNAQDVEAVDVSVFLPGDEL